MLSTVEILRRARETLSDPKRWTQKVFAEDNLGRPVYPDDPTATRWCLLGAIWRYTTQISNGPKIYLETAIRQRFPYGCITSFNDYTLRSHQDVLNVLDDALALAEEDEHE